MTKNQVKILFIAIIALPLIAIVGIHRQTVLANALADETTENIYKTKCAMCHSPKAEKAYDPAMPIEEQVNIILKGKKGEKPPNMPAYEGKLTTEQATALAEYMKSLRTPAN